LNHLWKRQLKIDSPDSDHNRWTTNGFGRDKAQVFDVPQKFRQERINPDVAASIFVDIDPHMILRVVDTLLVRNRAAIQA
jgi:hypothetical protein